MKVKPLYIILAITIGILIFMNAEKKEAVGAANWPSDCSFITNINPYTSSWSIYVDQSSTQHAWITADINSDNTKEAFGYVSGFTGSPGVRGSVCGGQGSSARLIKENYNSNGDDIYHYYIGGRDKLYVCNAAGDQAKYFLKDSNLFGGEVYSCGTTCTPNWQCTSWSTCTSGTQTRTCTDSNSCGVTTGKPSESQSCSVPTCNNPADTNTNCIIVDSELISYINRWLSSQVTDSQLISVINIWINGGSYQ